MDKNIVISKSVRTDILDKMKLSIFQYMSVLTKPFVAETASININTNESITYTEIFRKGEIFSHYLKELGCGKGTVIAIICENRVEVLSILLGAWNIGVICTFFFPDYSIIEIKHALGVSQPKLVFTSNVAFDKIQKIFSKSLPTIKLINIDVDNCIPKAQTYTDLLIESVNPSDVALIMFSSGTSGLPKGVKLNHSALVFLMELERSGEIFGPPNRSSILVLRSLSHISSLLMVLFSFSTGRIYVPVNDFDEEKLLKLIHKYRPPFIFLPSTFIVSLSKNSLLSKYDLSCLELIGIGGGFLGSEAEKKLEKIFHPSKILQMYGMTETTGPSIGSNKVVKKSGSIGTLLPGMMAKVIDLSNGTVLGPFQKGELCLKGPSLMSGYCLNELNNEIGFDVDGWIHTGDVVHYNDEFYFYVVDRIKELITYRNIPVPPAEIEMVLLGQDAVKEVCVVGIPDADAGELPRAYVVKNVGFSSVTEIELQQHVERVLSSGKQLRGGVIFVDELPKTAMGKINRGELKKWSVEEKI